MPASLLTRNIIANFTGKIWQSLMAFMFIPLYIKFLGIESYGVIGIFATIQAMCGVLDMGLSSTLNREMARLSVLQGREQEMRNLVRTLELIYWGIAIFIGIIVMVLSPFIAHYWIKAGKLSSETVNRVLMLVGFTMALQWPANFYSGGIRGLQRQVLLNVVNGVMSTIRAVGAVLVLWLISPTIQGFFLWQIGASALNTYLLAWFLWCRLPQGSESACFEKRLLRSVWQFAAGMTGITFLAMLLTQLDKVILSKMLSLERFGYYTLACVVCSGLSMIVAPIFDTVFPRFSALAIMQDNSSLRELYHTCTQLMAVLILPAAITLAFFSHEILFVWTGNMLTAQNTSPIVSVLVIGTALNALMYLPYTLQLAYGWTGIGIKICLFLIVVLVPAIIMLTNYYGPVGAACAWVALNIIYMMIGIPLTHHRLLRGEAKKWFYDIVYPSVSALTVVWIGRHLFTNFISTTRIVLPVAIVFLCAFISAVISSQRVRGLIGSRLYGGRPLW
jgi:O-antigen/teichoic acid export membrane protein